MALQALSEFAEKIFSPNFDVMVKISDDVTRHSFRIQRENSLVFQTAEVRMVSSLIPVIGRALVPREDIWNK